MILGLLASLGWGVGDFGGGLASRASPVLGVLLASQVASLLVGIPLLLLAAEAPMSPTDLAFAAVGGALGASGLALLYHGLSVGRMGVVMPISATITAALPVVFGVVTQGRPADLAIVGIGCAAIGVVLVSLSPVPPDGRPSGIWYGVVTGLIFGLFPIVASGISDDVLVGPVVAVRIASIATVAGAIVLGRQQWRVTRRMWPAMLGIGLADMLATAAYLAAIAAGPLAIAATLTSLSNVVTVVLAALVLRERITPIHALGIGAAGVAVMLIAASPA